MKRIVILALLLIVASCKEQKSKDKELAFNLMSVVTPIDVIKTSNFTVPVYNYDGFEKLLLANEDKTYIVNFWATWCKPCVKELPYFEKIHNIYKEQDVEVILVSLDFPKKVDEVLIPFLEKQQFNSNVVLLNDPKQNTWIPKVDSDWSGSIPATLIISENKRSFYEKSFTFIELEDALKDFITN
ncbi:redoxin domain-containing protein [Joostella atrarenae]|uniref:Redoxin domain-containing protein n=1 Tax=Joostella atrarenae TaxID=679257 RepID=A0ABS9J6X8_9FLAO|nr:TlpA disulfide reductase family protein [Joostella atrarenae]MCF8716083.1 redoxin domain-containing protein [Joostella atrarenae]